jgi:ferredoxin
VRAPRRARFLRTLALELERLYNHVGDVGNIAAGASYHYGASNGLRMREAFQQLNERLSGHRYLRGLVCLGGVRQDLTAELGRDLEALLASTEGSLADLMDRFENNPSVIDRMETTGVLKEKDALAGVTGSPRAAARRPRSARDHPHRRTATTAAPVQVATETDGDVRRPAEGPRRRGGGAVRLSARCSPRARRAPVGSGGLPAWGSASAPSIAARGRRPLAAVTPRPLDRYHLLAELGTCRRAWPRRARSSRTSRWSTRASSSATRARIGEPHMLKALLRSLRTGVVTVSYPAAPAPVPERFRGQPTVRPGAAFDALPKPSVCPSGALSLQGQEGGGGGAARYAIDVGRCVFCGRCSATGFAMGRQLELASRSARAWSSSSSAAPRAWRWSGSRRRRPPPRTRSPGASRRCWGARWR